ncbi:protein S100-A9-like [Mus pahari]|uniref:protein S100-A9-like n=1 Tax=Mus pahari TaxID=10093 RepID=UPI000A30FA73|nr:protein S100-A9-like [Mus pahari]
MAKRLTKSEDNIMMFYRIFKTFSAGKAAELTEKEFEKLLGREFPNFLQEIQESPLSSLLNERKNRSFEEALYMIGRMGMVYYKKMNNNAFEH